MSHDDVVHPPRSDGTNPEAPPLAPRAWLGTPGAPPGMWDRKESVDRLLYLFYGLCVLVVVLDIVIHRHIYHPWEALFGFHAWYGFAAFWILVAVAKRMRRVLMRPEDYYDGD
jgi:hypothetical protein